MAVRGPSAASQRDMDAAAAEVYEKYADELIRYASALVGPSGADDVLAATFARVFARPAWVQIGEIRAYLYRAVLNEARGQHRATKRRLIRDAHAAADLSGGQPSFVVRWEVLDAIRHLAVRQRAVVFLTYWADLRVDEIAARLDLSPRTVARDLAVAKNTLEELLT
jgi:RNA polymerase sigma factor (sigma-70 family)